MDNNSRSFVNPEYFNPRLEKEYSPQVNQNVRKQKIKFFQFIKEYFFLRASQLKVLLGLSLQVSTLGIINSKSFLVRKMYWGRTSFYKTSFHVIIIIITIIALITGLDDRIIATQKSTVENISVSDTRYVDSDIVYQQGSLFPMDELNETDSLYFDYTVKSGDTLEGIAKDNDINADTLRWANGIPSGRDTLAVGQVIKVPKVDGVLHKVKAGETVDSVLNDPDLKVNENDKLTFMELNSDYILPGEKLVAGSRVLIYNARIEVKPKVVPRPSTRSRGPTYVAPPRTGTNVPTGTFVNPMQASGGYGFSRGYSSGHTGVDLTVPPGRWIVAAGSGVVIQSGWCMGLGYCVAIQHANGYQTIYGHGNGVLAVSNGQAVAAGQKIMQSGCTGLCFGPHVHISITANNQSVYGCYRCRINPRGIIPY